jgi:SWI/SNF-related matrix-associated actin-dependent regulator of chromatin subfamily A3
MGLGKTITCVSLISATLDSAKSFAVTPLEPVNPPQSDVRANDKPSAAQFLGSVWGMPDVSEAPASMSLKAKAKAARLQEKLEANYTRACRIKARSRATLIICPLSTVSNWEDQFREHWRGEVTVVGGAGMSSSAALSQIPGSLPCTPSSSQPIDVKPDVKQGRIREGRALRVYVYHGNARRPDPAFLADFDAVITTYATLASEFSKQNRSIASTEEDEEDEGSSDGGGVEIDERGNPVIRLPKPRKNGLKRKKSMPGTSAVEITSALQSIHWFRVVLDEAQYVYFSF